MKSVRFFALFSFLLGVCGISLAAIALGTVRWRESFADTTHEGLFESCNSNVCISNGVTANVPSWLHATRAFIIMGVAVHFINLLILLVVVFKGGVSRLDKVPGALFFVAGAFLLVGTAVYTGINRPNLAANNQTFGFSLWLAWASVIVTILSAPFGFMAKDRKTFM